MKNNAKVLGFTLVEILIVLALSSLILLAAVSLFFSAVKTTIKGQDNIDTSRAVSMLFKAINNDMKNVLLVSTDKKLVLKIQANQQIPSNPDYSTMLQITSRNSTTITYSLVGTTGKQYVERTMVKGSNTSTKRFGLPRMQEFKVLKLTVENIIGKKSYWFNQILVLIEANSNAENIVSRTTRLVVAFFPEEGALSNWNYLK